MMHVGLGRTHPLHIEYIHIGATLAVIQDILTEAIFSHPRLPTPRKIAIVKALGKVIWIQNDLFAKWYVEDGQEFTDGMDYGPIEKEGWLHGKKILDDAWDDTQDDETEEDGRKTPVPLDHATEDGEKAHDRHKASGLPRPSRGTCPFTGMSASMQELKVED